MNLALTLSVQSASRVSVKSSVQPIRSVCVFLIVLEVELCRHVKFLSDKCRILQ